MNMDKDENSSMMDVENLDEKQKYRELPDTYVIFITENDYYKAGKPVYFIQNMNLTLGKPFDDDAHILYVNGEYRDDSDIGKLMHDFNCTSADDMHFGILAEKTRYLKENPKGVSEMCKVIHIPNASPVGSHILSDACHAPTMRRFLWESRLLSPCGTCRSKAGRPRPCSPPALR